MAQHYQSEIRDSSVRDLLAKVKASSFGSYLRRMKITKIRAFKGEVVDFDFPVTALIAANGGGKSSILGAAALAYKNTRAFQSTRPAIFFPKSSLGDDSMANWGVSFELIDKAKNPTQLIPKSARFKNSKWARDEVLERPILYFGITRTVPAGERTEFKKSSDAQLSLCRQENRDIAGNYFPCRQNSGKGYFILSSCEPEYRERFLHRWRWNDILFGVPFRSRRVFCNQNGRTNRKRTKEFDGVNRRNRKWFASRRGASDGGVSNRCSGAQIGSEHIHNSL